MWETICNIILYPGRLFWNILCVAMAIGGLIAWNLFLWGSVVGVILAFLFFGLIGFTWPLIALGWIVPLVPGKEDHFIHY